MTDRYKKANEKARILWRENRGIKPKELRERLQKDTEILNHEIPKTDKQLKRWLDDFNKENIKEELIQDVRGIGDIVYRDKKESYVITSNFQSPNLELINPPSLVEELIVAGIPEKEAPELLSRWDLAYRAGDSYQTNICHNTMEIYKDEGWKGIDYKRALALGELITKYTMFQISDAGYIETLKRYKPWLSKERSESYTKVFSYLVETEIKPRMKEAEKALKEAFNTLTDNSS